MGLIITSKISNVRLPDHVEFAFFCSFKSVADLIIIASVHVFIEKCAVVIASDFTDMVAANGATVGIFVINFDCCL